MGAAEATPVGGGGEMLRRTPRVPKSNVHKVLFDRRGRKRSVEDRTWNLPSERLLALEREIEAWFSERIEVQPSGSKWLGLDLAQMMSDCGWWMRKQCVVPYGPWEVEWLKQKLATSEGVRKYKLSEEFHGYECWSVQPKGGAWLPSARLLPDEAAKELTLEPGPWFRMGFECYGEALEYLLHKFGTITSCGRFIGLMGPLSVGAPGGSSEDHAYEWLPDDTGSPFGAGILRASIADVPIEM